MRRCATRPSLDQRTLDILAERGSRRVAAAIAARDGLAEATARILVYRDEAPTDLALAQKSKRDLPPDVVSLLCARARGNLVLAELMLARQASPFANAARSSSRPSRRNGPRSRPRRHAAAI